MEWQEFNKTLCESELARSRPDYVALHAKRFFDTLVVLERARPAGDSPKLLDVGIYPGLMTLMASKLGYGISGISNEEMTPQFRDFCDKNEFQISQADLEVDPLPYEDDTFDAILCTEIIEHMHKNPFKLISECYRVLKPGGTLLVSTPNLARLPVIRGLKHGMTYMPPLDGPLDESFPVTPCYTHAREYTIGEVVYITCEQDKYLYQFEEIERNFSRCWDPGARNALDSLLHLRNIRTTVGQWIMQTLRRHLRSCLILTVKKPDTARWVSADDFSDVTGFFDEVEVDVDTTNKSRRPLETPFRWTLDNASFSFTVPDLPQNTGDVKLRLQYGYNAPFEAPHLKTKFTINGQTALELNVEPIKTYQTIEMVIPREALKAGKLTIGIETDTWTPTDIGIDDPRTRGIMLSWDRILIS